MEFKKLLRSKKKISTHSCSNCGNEAEKKLSTFGMNFKGKGFRNTDHASFDRKVGADAEAKWEKYKENWQEKRRLQRENPDKVVVKESSGSYSVQESQ